MAEPNDLSTLKKEINDTFHSRYDFVKIYRPFLWLKFAFADFFKNKF